MGIVEKVENGRIHTVEGNSGDMCRENSYPLGSAVVYGYGYFFNNIRRIPETKQSSVVGSCPGLPVQKELEQDLCIWKHLF